MNDSRLSERARPFLAKIRELVSLIRDNADRAEREAQLPSAVVEAFHQTGLFRILLPREFGGADVTIPDSLRLCEEVSAIDGSAGWNLAICSSSPLFTNCLPRAAFEKIYNDPRAVGCGSLNPMTSQVVRKEGGWCFSGRATYASGSAQSNWLVAAALVLHEGAPRFVDGIPELRAGFFPMKNAKILDTWHMTGMSGTGSNDCVFENVMVADQFTFDWLHAQPAWRGQAYQTIPLPIQFVGNLACVSLGIARHALDELKQIAKTKVPVATRAILRERPIAQTQVAQAEGLLQAARAWFYNVNDEIWRRGLASDTFTVEDRATARLASVTATKLALQAIDLVADAAGMNANQTASPISRCWRDAHTASQHVLLNTARFEVIGRVMFGLDPGSPVI